MPTGQSLALRSKRDSPWRKGEAMNAPWTASEVMVVNAARLLRDGDVVLVGVGLPNLACNLALRTHAPGLVMVYESGVVGARPSRIPLSIGDPALVDGALMVSSMYELFANILQRGHVSVGFLGGAQIDRYGNVNATMIGSDYHHPRVRLPGSGGSQEIAAWAERTYLMASHERRRFPARCDFCTSLGSVGPTGNGERGVPGAGPVALVTDLGLLAPDPQGELVLTHLHPGVDVETVKDATGWKLKIGPDLAVTPTPTPSEIDVLHRLDPHRIYLR
jgi:glutaconate CoA-transferase subunit B